MTPGRELLAQALRDGARAQIGVNITTPDGDWTPAALVAAWDGTVHTLGMMGEPAERAAALPRVVRQLKATAVARVESCWLAIPQPGEKVEPGFATAHPERQEVLLVTALDVDACDGWLAHITRGPDGPPSLGEWEPAADELAGLQVDPIREALREARFDRATGEGRR